MRLVLFSAYTGEPIWSSLWEEVTELLFVSAVGFVLWVFRDSLFIKPSPAGSSQPTLERVAA